MAGKGPRSAHLGCLQQRRVCSGSSREFFCCCWQAKTDGGRKLGYVADEKAPTAACVRPHLQSPTATETRTHTKPAVSCSNRKCRPSPATPAPLLLLLLLLLLLRLLLIALVGHAGSGEMKEKAISRLPHSAKVELWGPRRRHKGNSHLHTKWHSQLQEVFSVCCCFCCCCSCRLGLSCSSNGRVCCCRCSLRHRSSRQRGVADEVRRED